MTNNYSGNSFSGAEDPSQNPSVDPIYGAPVVDANADQAYSASDGAYLSGETPTRGSQDDSGKAEQTKQAALDEKDHLKGEATASGDRVKSTVMDEAVNVKDEAADQAKSLWHQAKSDLDSQASTQKDRVAGTVRGFSDDLQAIQRGETPQNDASIQLLSMATDKVGALANHLESRDPQGLLDDVRRFAARRPVAFLAVAAGVGLLAGRLTRGLKDAGSDDSSSAGHDSNGAAGQRRPAAPQTPAITPQTADPYAAENQYTADGQYTGGPSSPGTYGTGQLGEGYGTGYEEPR